MKKKTDYKFYHTPPKQNFKRCKPKAQLPFIYRNILLCPRSSRCITDPQIASKDSKPSRIQYEDGKGNRDSQSG